MADFSTWDRATLEQFAQEATDKLVAMAEAEMWTRCVFQGNPPEPYSDWNSWCGSKQKEGVTIRSSTLEDWERPASPNTSAPPIFEGEPEIRWVYRHDGNEHIAGAPTIEDALKHLSIPEGWQLVPVDPTDEMLMAAANSGAEGTYNELTKDYKAMLAAAPKHTKEAA